MIDRCEKERGYQCRAWTIFAERRRRIRHFDDYGDMFGEPGWDILLRLFIACHRAEAIGPTDLACEIGFPLSSTSRWTGRLEALGLIRRTIDDRDNRRVLLSLTEAAQAGMRAFLDKIQID